MSWSDLPDLAVRTRGGSVVMANDETFGEKENLIKPDVPAFQPHTFGHHGQIMDGWETRRRREPGDDWAIVRLGIQGVVRVVVVDTAWFTGNYPPHISVEAVWVDPLDPSAGPAELIGPSTAWDEIVPRSPVQGDGENGFAVDHDRLVTHVRLWQHPDGGVARLRVHGEPVGDPRWVADRSFDLASMDHGGSVLDCSNRFYSAPDNLLAPGRARVMGEGWETSRRRDEGNDWVVVRLAAAGVVRQLEIDTSCFVGNAPGAAAVVGFDSDSDSDSDSGSGSGAGSGSGSGAGSGEVQLLPRASLQPDAVNRFVLEPADPVERLRLDVFPDGGLARLRAWGEPSSDGRADLFLGWYDRLTTTSAGSALTGWGGADDVWAHALAAGRPYRDSTRLAGAVAALPGTAPEPAAWAALTGLEYLRV